MALHVASAQVLRLKLLALGALAMGLGICTMHYTGMGALEMAPGINWNPWLVAASAAIAVAASAVALRIFFWLCQTGHTRERHAQFGWQVLAALVMGAAICGMHYTGMAAAHFVDGAICLNSDQLRGDNLGLLVSVATVALLTLTLFTAALDARMQGKTAQLAASLQTANLELQQLAFRDALTGLPNRLLFDDRVATAVQRSVRDGASLAVLFVDLDGFKPVNDSFGHACGDAVLREMAKRLAAQARDTDTIARIGGDEFVVLLEGNPDAAAVARIADRIIDTIAAPMHSAEHEVRLGCSIGIAMYPTDGPRDKLLAHADAAMYAAKRAGGASYAFFQPHMNADIRDQIALRHDLRLALDAGDQLELHYQPKVSAQRGVVTSAEALVRWQHPQFGPAGARRLHPDGRALRPDRRVGRMGDPGVLPPNQALARPGAARARGDQPVGSPAAPGRPDAARAAGAPATPRRRRAADLRRSPNRWRWTMPKAASAPSRR